MISQTAERWAAMRGISRSTLEALGVDSGTKDMPGAGKGAEVIAFPYRRAGKIVNVKYRALKSKDFMQVTGGELRFWNLDNVLRSDGSLAYVVEGECFPPDAQVLTPAGWVQFRHLRQQKIAQYEPDGTLSFVHPMAIIKKTFQGDLVRHDIKGWASLTTPDHNLVAFDYKKRLRKFAAKDGTSAGDLIPRAGRLDGDGINLDLPQIALCIAVSADAAIDQRKNGSRYVRFALTKKRKIDRLRIILAMCGITHSDNPIKGGEQSICFPIPSWIPGRLLPHDWVGSATVGQREFILSEMVHWDGNSVSGRNQSEYSTIHLENAEFMQAIAHTAGRCSSIMRRKNQWGAWFKVSILHGKKTSSWQSVKTTAVPYDGDVFCATVKSGMLIVRQDEKVTISGNCDSLALVEAGVPIGQVLSVPNGAPLRSSEKPDEQDRYRYVDTALKEGLARVKRFVIAVDNDAPGLALRQDLVRLLGPARCWFIDWPADIKDANEFLERHGPEALNAYLSDGAKEWPVEGLYRLSELPEPSPLELWSPGFPEWEGKLRFASKTMSVVTGAPGMGKTALMMQIWHQICRDYGVVAAIASFETRPKPHQRRALRQFMYAKPQGDLTDAQIAYADRWIDDHFVWIVHPNKRPNLRWMLDTAEVAIIRNNARVVQIDPWNKLESDRPKDTSETDWIGQCLDEILDFANDLNVHVQILAHPSKRDATLRKNPVALEEISGCYSSDTEVLTKNGWAPHDKITISDKVCCFDPISQKLRYEYPSVIHAYEYSGEMHHYHGYSLDMLVTPNHRMVLQAAWPSPKIGSGKGRPQVWSHDGQWEFALSRDLRSAKYRLPLAAPLDLLGVSVDEIPGVADQSYAWAFVGWYVSEGWDSTKAPQVCQAVGQHEQIQGVLSKIGLPFHEKFTHYVTHEKPMWSARIYRRGNEEFCDWILSQCGRGAPNKRLPPSIWDQPRIHKKMLFDALIAGDGHQYPYRWYRKRQSGCVYSTTSRQLANDVQRLAIELGMYASVSSVAGAQSHHLRRYWVTIGHPDRKERVIVIPRNRSIVDYSGTVYCLTVPTGAYVTRRNGKMSICGNSRNWDNKTDLGLSVHRPQLFDKGDRKTEADLYVMKSRYEECGYPCKLSLNYDLKQRRYVSLDYAAGL